MPCSGCLRNTRRKRATSTIAVVIFAAFIGFAFLRVLRKQPEQGNLLKRGIDAVYALVMAIVSVQIAAKSLVAIVFVIIAKIPYGVKRNTKVTIAITNA